MGIIRPTASMHNIALGIYLVVQEDACGWQCSLIRLIDAVKFVQPLTLISDYMLVTHN